MIVTKPHREGREECLPMLEQAQEWPEDRDKQETTAKGSVSSRRADIGLTVVEPANPKWYDYDTASSINRVAGVERRSKPAHAERDAPLFRNMVRRQRFRLRFIPTTMCNSTQRD